MPDIIPERSPSRTPCESYWAQTTGELDALGEKLANIRADVETGDITIREAADERVQVLSDHLARLIELRSQHFGTE